MIVMNNLKYGKTYLTNQKIKKNKYGNKKCVYRGMIFASKKELGYYLALKDLEKQGKITDLKRQVEFELQPSFTFNGKKIRAIKYIADFTYIENDKLHIVDTKGVRTDVYELKKKMMMYKGYEIEEI